MRAKYLGGLQNHPRMFAIPADTGWFYVNTQFQALAVGTVLSPGSGLRTSEVADYHPIGFRLRVQTKDTTNTTATFRVRGETVYGEELTEDVSIESNASFDGVVVWTENAWSRIDSVTLLAAANRNVGDTIRIGYPALTMWPPVSQSTLQSRSYFLVNAANWETRYTIPVPPERLIPNGERRARLVLSQNGSGTTAAVHGDVVVLTDRYSLYRWELDDGSPKVTAYPSIDITGLTTAAQVRDAVIAAINALGTYFRAAKAEGLPDAQGVVDVFGSSSTTYLECFDYNPGTNASTLRSNLTFLPIRKIHHMASVYNVDGGTPAVITPGEYVDITVDGNRQRFEYVISAGTSAPGVIEIDADTPNDQSTAPAILQTTINADLTWARPNGVSAALADTTSTFSVVILHCSGNFEMRDSRAKSNLVATQGRPVGDDFRSTFLLGAMLMQMGYNAVTGDTTLPIPGLLRFAGLTPEGFSVRREPCAIVVDDQAGTLTGGGPQAPVWDVAGTYSAAPAAVSTRYPQTFYGAQSCGMYFVVTHFAPGLQSYFAVPGYPNRSQERFASEGRATSSVPSHSKPSLSTGAGVVRGKP